MNQLNFGSWAPRLAYLELIRLLGSSLDDAIFPLDSVGS